MSDTIQVGDTVAWTTLDEHERPTKHVGIVKHVSRAFGLADIDVHGRMVTAFLGELTKLAPEEA